MIFLGLAISGVENRISAAGTRMTVGGKKNSGRASRAECRIFELPIAKLPSRS
jgi:hypothetical protein